MTTKKQITANQKNAKKGGVKTKKGKESSKMNALKHGILSKHLFVSTGADFADHQEFNTLKQSFFEELQPVGIVETLLVDRLFSTFWRLKRLHIAEVGYIEKQQASQFMQFMFDKMEMYGTGRKDPENTFYTRIRTREGCSHMETFWKAICEKLNENGPPLSDNMISNIKYELGGASGFYKVEAFCLFNKILRDKKSEKLTKDDIKGMTEWMVETANTLHDMFKSLAHVLERDEEDEKNGDQKIKMIPPMKELETIQRYDAHLQRLMMQTLHELQRVQSKRLGHAAPLAAALDVTLDSENGFVS